MTWDKNIAKLFKKRDNPVVMGPLIGTVIQDTPVIKISVFSGQVILEEQHLYINECLLSNHKRQMITNGLMDLNDAICGQTNYQTDHSHVIDTLEVTEGNFSSEGEIILTDTLKMGDEVLLLPTNNHQKFFIICKVRKLGD